MLEQFRERLATSFKQFRFAGLASSDIYSAAGMLGLSPYGFALPGTRYDWQRDASPLWLNATVLACVNWVSDVWPEAPQCLYRRPENDTDTEEQENRHPCLDLLAEPNPDYDDSVLLGGTIVSLLTAGNAYWYKVRDRLRRPVQLQYLPHFTVEPFWPKDNSRFIDGYAYRVQGETTLLPREDVIHLRHKMDPLNIRKGLSPLAAAYRSVGWDNEAETFGATILKNMGIPGVLIMPADVDQQLTLEQADILKRMWMERFTGDFRGDPLTTNARVKIEQVAFSPEQMALDHMSRTPVNRICASLNIDPMVIGLPSESKTFSNYEEALKAAWTNMLIPAQTRIASQLTQQLLREFTADPSIRIGFDHTKVRALSEDTTALYKRLTEAVGGPWVSPDEARQQVGMEKLPDGAGDKLYPKSTPGAFGQESGGGGARPPEPPPKSALALEMAAKWRARRQLAENGAGNGAR